MSLYKLEQDKLDQLPGKLTGKYTVYTPARGPEGWKYFPAGDASPPGDYLLTRLPVKEFVAPLYETLLEFDGPEGTPAAPDTQKRVVFGVRPCDARALRLLDKVFLEGNYVDPFYKARRENTVLVVTACKQPAPTCFCTSTGGGPGDTYGADVIVYPGNENHWRVLDALTGKGKTALDGLNLDAANEKELAEAQSQNTKVAENITVLFPLDKTQEALKKQFDSDIWNTLADRCLACGVCTFVCPSCSCFDVSDEAKRGKGRRYRLSDGCMFPIFTYHASGHNPREYASQRYRQRVNHKFHYFPARNGGLNLCVGCGRCVVDCPVNIDIREAVRLAVDTQYPGK